MKPQKPAEGILLNNNWGETKLYKVICNCGDDSHNHDVWIESDDHGVQVNIYTTVKTNYWSVSIWKNFWQLLTKGYIEQEATIMLSEQQALNYATTLKQAIEDVKSFKQSRT
jgi:hypothetical protein